VGISLEEVVMSDRLAAWLITWGVFLLGIVFTVVVWWTWGWP
jgi:hypothetical protein